MNALNKYLNDFKQLVKDAWLEKEASTLSKVTYIIFLVFISLIALPIVPFHRDRFDFGACIIGGIVVWYLFYLIITYLFQK